MSADTTAVAGQTTAHADDHHGPTDKKLWQIAGILAVITAIEVAWSYLPWSDWGHGFAIVAAEVGGLLFMMVIKFVIVASYFMHLKWDSKLLTRIFYGGLFLAIAVYLAALATFEFFTGGT